MEGTKLSASYDNNSLPTAWDFKNISLNLSLNLNGLQVSYKGSDDYKVADIIRANNPVHPQCGLFYFEVKIINKGINGMIEIGFCTKQIFMNIKTNNSNVTSIPRQENNLLSYHGDDGYFYYSGSGRPYGPLYITGDTIGCYINFKTKIVFFTKNGVNLGIACCLPDDFKDALYPCARLRSQGACMKANFGHKQFKYSVMTHDIIKSPFRGTRNPLSLKYRGKVYFLIGIYKQTLVDLTDDLTESLKNQNFDTSGAVKLVYTIPTTVFSKATYNSKPVNISELIYRGKAYFIMGKYKEALVDLIKSSEIIPNSAIDRYKCETYYLMRNYEEFFINLDLLIKNSVNDTNELHLKWAEKALGSINEIISMEGKDQV